MAGDKRSLGRKVDDSGAGAFNQVKLLVAFDALLREGSVSRAAASLKLQVSAVSRMLAELRKLYDDPIFIRTGQGMRPTPFAESLRLRVRGHASETELLLAANGSTPLEPAFNLAATPPEPATVASPPSPDEWAVETRANIVPLSVTPADQLEAAPTPRHFAVRIATIGDNADPHRRLARYIATTAPGPGRSRPLTQDEARDALALILDGQADPLQVGALLMTIHYRGASASELAGFAEAIRNTMAIPAKFTRPDLDWPAYVSPKVRTAPWFLHAARLVAMAGHKVLLHGHYGSGPESGKMEMAAEDAGIPVCLTLADASAALTAGGIAFTPLGSLAPQTRSLLGLHAMFEMRNPLHSAIHLINPLGAKASILGASQSSRRDLYRDVARHLDLPNIALIGSVRDVAEYTPGRMVKIFRMASGVDADITVPAGKKLRPGTSGMLTQREYWQAIWSGAARDEWAEAVIQKTAAVAFLALTGDPQAKFEDCLPQAVELWAARQR
ncbi:glycosyl transferase family protein [Rhizobiales bacterium RZME27]|uniref:Glycosyl transferase family protein n=1 Tax=Endobacterium cereale TaxID=2663029 RepID=A0A6A8AHH5_9HYPH|nr:glycosyl transferase family protein [Endobacterium cereale]MEB2844265.1 glycosyl transferase family protein [Endobacterium cereale]MQY48676.1 glycosyl transferase family protein [Endobacterium cereale]